MLSAPLHWVGLLSDDQVVSVKIFTNYIERQDIPFSIFNVIIKSRGEASPKVLSAVVRVHLRTGFSRRVLYHLRPHSLIALSMGAGAICAILGGSLVAGLCIAVLGYTFIIRSRKQGEEAGGEDGSGVRYSRPGSSISGDLSSEAGFDLLDGGTSSSTGTTPRQSDLGEEDEEGAAAATAAGGGGGSPLSPSSKEEKPWQVLLKQIPFPSPRQRSALGEDDTQFVAGEAGAAMGGASGRTELGGAGMRYRGGGDTIPDEAVQ